MAAGNRHLGYKDALNRIEETSPGSKHDFYFGFLSRAAPLFRADQLLDAEGLVPCERCGAPTPVGVCAFCRLAERSSAAEPVPLSIGRPRQRRSSTTPGSGTVDP